MRYSVDFLKKNYNTDGKQNRNQQTYSTRTENKALY